MIAFHRVESNINYAYVITYTLYKKVLSFWGAWLINGMVHKQMCG